MTGRAAAKRTAGAVAGPSVRSGRGEWARVLRRAARSRRGAIGLALAGVIVLLAIVGPFVTPHSATAFVTIPYSKPSGAAPLGGDELGRDVLSRVLDGGWVLLIVATAATLIGVVIGLLVGVPAAYLGGRVDGLMMRAVDVLLAFPQLVFALMLVSVIGPKLWLVAVAVGLAHAPQVARVVRSAAIDVCERDFVRAVELLWTPRWRIVSGEILPNITTIVMIECGLRMAWSIILIAGLSFIGFGLQPPAANWALMINENRVGLTANPWAVLVPAALIVMLTVGLNTFTDAVARVSLGVDRGSDAVNRALVIRSERA